MRHDTAVVERRRGIGDHNNRTSDVYMRGRFWLKVVGRSWTGRARQGLCFGGGLCALLKEKGESGGELRRGKNVTHHSWGVSRTESCRLLERGVYQTRWDGWAVSRGVVDDKQTQRYRYLSLSILAEMDAVQC